MDRKLAQTPELLTVPEVARLLRLTRASVYGKIAEGEIPAVRLGQGRASLRVRSDELEQWLQGPER